MIPGALRALYNAALPAVLVAALPGQLLKMRRRGGAMRYDEFPGLQRR